MQVIYGVNPLIEAMKGGRAEVRSIVLASGKKGEPIRRILALAAEKGIPVEFRKKDEVDKLTGNRSNQGVAGICGPYAYAAMDELLANRHASLAGDLVLILDGITDPQNLGSLIRTAQCCGANGVIIPENRAAPVTAAVIKSSAGAVQHTPVAAVVNLGAAIDYLKEKGFWVYAADPEAGNDFRNMDYDGNVALVMGSEGKGIRPLVRKKCDFSLSAPMLGKVDSLNVSVAAGIILYHISGKLKKGD
jgi:23S rRNA (guanosine2251-2'-O)-methyltransferase